MNFSDDLSDFHFNAGRLAGRLMLERVRTKLLDYGHSIESLDALSKALLEIRKTTHLIEFRRSEEDENG